MKAVLCTDFGDATVTEIPDPEPGPDEVLVAVDTVQLSITECRLFHGEKIAGYDIVSERLKHGDGRIFGHEFCGSVVEIGSAVSEVEVDDRVYAPGKISCRTCTYCESGYPEYCERAQTIGFHRPGALAEYIRLPAESVYKIDDAVSDSEGAALQPLVSALLCVHDAALGTGDFVTIFGAGVMGLNCGQVALHHGADRVCIVDLVPKKLEIAEELGMIGIDATETDPIEEISARTDGVGSDVVFEAVGGPQSHASDGSGPLAQSFRSLRKGGTIVQVGLLGEAVTVSPQAFRGKMVRWIFPRDGCGVLPHGPYGDSGEVAARLVASGRISLTDYITHTLEDLESFEEAIRITRNKEEYDALGPAQIELT